MFGLGFFGKEMYKTLNRKQKTQTKTLTRNVSYLCVCALKKKKNLFEYQNDMKKYILKICMYVHHYKKRDETQW